MTANELRQAAEVRRSELTEILKPLQAELDELNRFCGQQQNNKPRDRRSNFSGEHDGSTVVYWVLRAVAEHPNGIESWKARKWIKEQGGVTGNARLVGLTFINLYHASRVRRLGRGIYAPLESTNGASAVKEAV